MKSAAASCSQMFRIQTKRDFNELFAQLNEAINFSYIPEIEVGQRNIGRKINKTTRLEKNL